MLAVRDSPIDGVEDRRVAFDGELGNRDYRRQLSRAARCRDTNRRSGDAVRPGFRWFFLHELVADVTRRSRFEQETLPSPGCIWRVVRFAGNGWYRESLRRRRALPPRAPGRSAPALRYRVADRRKSA